MARCALLAEDVPVRRRRSRRTPCPICASSFLVQAENSRTDLEVLELLVSPCHGRDATDPPDVTGLAALGTARTFTLAKQARNGRPYGSPAWMSCWCASRLSRRKRERLHESGSPRLLLLEDGSEPPPARLTRWRTGSGSRPARSTSAPGSPPCASRAQAAAAPDARRRRRPPLRRGVGVAAAGRGAADQRPPRPVRGRRLPRGPRPVRLARRRARPQRPRRPRPPPPSTAGPPRPRDQDGQEPRVPAGGRSGGRRSTAGGVVDPRSGGGALSLLERRRTARPAGQGARRFGRGSPGSARRGGRDRCRRRIRLRRRACRCGVVPGGGRRRRRRRAVGAAGPRPGAVPGDGPR